MLAQVPLDSCCRRRIRVPFLLLGLFAVSSLSAILEVAGGEILTVNSLSVAYESNPNLREEGGEGDYRFIYSPGLRFVRSEGRSSLSAQVQATIERWAERDELDNTGYNASASASFPTAPGSRLSGGASVSASRTERVDDFANERSQIDSYSLSVNTGYRLTNRLSANAGGSWSRSSRGSASLSDTTTYAFNGGLSRALREGRLQVGASFGYNSRESEGGFGSSLELTGYDARITVNGEITDRINGSASFGYEISQIEGIDEDEGSFVASGSLNWSRNRTGASLSFSRSEEITSQGRAVTSNRASLSVSQNLTQKLSASVTGSVLYADGRIEGGTDQTYTGSIGANYSFNKYWSASCGADYRWRDTGGSRENFTARFSTSFTY